MSPSRRSTRRVASLPQLGRYRLTVREKGSPASAIQRNVAACAFKSP